MTQLPNGQINDQMVNDQMVNDKSLVNNVHYLINRLF